MMQEEATRSLNNLSLGGGAGNRSSVVDRVKWIEKTHGGGPPAQGAQPRARLRLPKHFINAQADVSIGSDAVLSPKTQAAGLLSPVAAAKLPLAMTQQKSATKIPTLARRTDQMPSPVISEASTVAAADEVFTETAVAKDEAEKEEPDFVPVAKDEEEKNEKPVFVSVAKAEVVLEIAPTEVWEAKVEAQSPKVPPPATDDELARAAPMEPKLVEPVVPVDAPVEAVPVEDLIEVEPVGELPIVEKSTSRAEPTHARMPSEALSTASNCSDASNISKCSVHTDSSNLTDPDDPVHVTSTMGSENNGSAGANTTLQTPAAEVSVSHYATLPRSTKFAGSKAPGLGGTRNRPQHAPRRYDRSQPLRPESSGSMRSEDSGRSSVFSRPKVEAPRLYAKEQPVVRSFSTKPGFARSTSVASGESGSQDESGSSSLLARLNDLSATRPNAQDLVSNRSSPKFVKRSQYYGPSSQDDMDNDIVSLELHSAPELTTIMSGPNNDYTSFAMLAYLNSRSLTSLVTRMHKERDWLDLIYGDTKVPAVFSRLKRLSLYITKADYNGTWAGVKGVEMFPNLSSLEVTGAYLFVDDLLFRGNGATLQILHVPFKLVATNILGELGILDRKGVTRMRRIRFAKVTESDREHIKANGREVIARQLYRVMDVTTSLYLSCDGPDYKMYREMIITPCVSSIQHLNVGKPIYQHNHVIRVIRALPNLVSFTATIGNYERLGDDTECCRKAEDLYREFYPLGSAFRILRVLSTLWYTGYQIAEEVIRIAIVCPKPLLVYVPSDKEELFKTAVSEAIASEEFAPYADSLRHLI
ncbi:hypothetical protein GGI01_003292 [Coemansia sp. RSA 376]|nr:hypothetical protein GGI01_003292 [Coemansia sp. RSA 376]